MVKIQLPTAKLRVDKKELLKKQEEQQAILRACENRRTWGFCGFLIVFVLGTGIDQPPARNAFMLLIALGGAGFAAYVPPQMTEAKAELEKIQELLDMFPPSD